METTVCRRCLLKDLTDSDYFGSIYAYIDSLTPEQKAPAEVYNSRLAACRECEELRNGMCALCGCFVEVRAAKRNSRCAAGSSARW